MHRHLCAVMLALYAGTPAVTAGQVVLDRTVQRVYTSTIMSSDVRQAKLLKLVPDVSSDDAVLTALENRLLMLREAGPGRGEPDPKAIAERRQVWTASWPAGTDLPALMTRAGMTDQALDGWFRDELRIAQYLDQRFGQLPERAGRIATWLQGLRQRAYLPNR